MAMKIAPRRRRTTRPFVGMGAFALVVALFEFVGSSLGMRGIGLVMIAVAAMQLKEGRIAYGWENREPSGYIEGAPAMAFSLAMSLAGLGMVFRPMFFVELFGWFRS